MSLEEMTITLSDKDGRISVDTLRRALENMLEILKSVESAVVSSDFEVRWDVIRVRMRSPLRMTFAPHVAKRGRTKSNRPAERRLVRAAMIGLDRAQGGKSVPREFNDDAIDATLKLVKTASNEGASVAFESPIYKQKIVLTENSADRLRELSAKARLYVDYSTIEGRLEIVSIHEHNSVFIWETLTNNKVECLVSSDQLAQASDLLGRRIAVTGRVHFRNHVPKSVTVEEPFRVLRDDAPQPADIGPLDITDGLSSEEHVWRMRNA